MASISSRWIKRMRSLFLVRVMSLHVNGVNLHLNGVNSVRRTSTATNSMATPVINTEKSGKNAHKTSVIDVEEFDDTTLDIKPKEVVKHLDRYIIGQDEAKRNVAIAMRNRWRRHKMAKEIRDEAVPKNILMVGPTGCGKTEIARRLAKLTSSPFIKTEMTKYTEVGYHGKDVDSIIQDLVKTAIQMLKAQRRAKIKEKVAENVEAKLLNYLVGEVEPISRQGFEECLRNGGFESQTVEVELPMREPEVESAGGKREIDLLKLTNHLRFSGRRTESRRLTVKEARPLLEEMEMDMQVNPDEITKAAIRAVEQNGIVFLDEIDKIAQPSNRSKHTDASSEGVQRDLLPIIEGTVVNTKQGDVRTDHILFIASGAFSAVKPDDMMPELLGRLPVRVSLKALDYADFLKILSQTENNLLKQQVALLEVEGVNLRFTDDAVEEIARTAVTANHTIENIGARRLHTIVEKIMEDINFDASEVPKGTEMVVDGKLVSQKMAPMLVSADLMRYVL